MTDLVMRIRRVGILLQKYGSEVVMTNHLISSMDRRAGPPTSEQATNRVQQNALNWQETVAL